MAKMKKNVTPELIFLFQFGARGCTGGYFPLTPLARPLQKACLYSMDPE